MNGTRSKLAVETKDHLFILWKNCSSIEILVLQKDYKYFLYYDYFMHLNLLA